LPWADATLCGWILDPDRKKMSKSKGNVVTPMPLVEEYGADALRYWACNGRPGVDTAVDYGVMKIGRKLAVKILNASKFVLRFAGESDEAIDAVEEPLDLAFLGALADLVNDATAAFDQFDYARSLERTERFFWSFCDDYLELVKDRAYGSRGDAAASSARRTLRFCLSTLLRLFAPCLPYVTEEVWSWWRAGSVHRAPWPAAAPIASDVDVTVFTVASEVLGAVRKAKSEQKVSLASLVDRVVVRGTTEQIAALDAASADVCEAGKIASLETEVGTEFGVTVELAETDAA
jgi:valyl-tRNA synthetase